jgi:hypothetical protein
MFLKNCLQQWDNVTGATGYDITINEQLLADVESPFLYQNAQPGTEYFVTIRAKNSGGIGLQEELIIIESIRTVHAVARFMLQWQIHFGMAVPKFPDKFADGSLTNNNPFFLHKVLPDIRSGTPFFPGHLHNLDFCVSLKKWGNSNFMPYCILDFFSARNEKYEKIKNQLPLFLRKYNHEKIKAIVMTSGSRMLFFMSFLLGIVISVCHSTNQLFHLLQYLFLQIVCSEYIIFLFNLSLILFAPNPG